MTLSYWLKVWILVNDFIIDFSEGNPFVKATEWALHSITVQGFFDVELSELLQAVGQFSESQLICFTLYLQFVLALHTVLWNRLYEIINLTSIQDNEVKAFSVILDCLKSTAVLPNSKEMVMHISKKYNL